MKPTSTPFRRSRLACALAALAVVGLGLFWRSGHVPLPRFLGKYGGDSLWALMVFFGFGFLFPRRSTWRVGGMALVFSCVIEFLQLYHAPWIDRIRATRPGHWVLGSTFHAPDLLAYAVGVAVGVLVEWTLFRGSSTGAATRDRSE